MFDISSTIFTNLSVFKSSKGASTSSNKQNGAGFRLKIANTKANAVSAFSPPESCEIDEFFLPGGIFSTGFVKGLWRLEAAPAHSRKLLR